MLRVRLYIDDAFTRYLLLPCRAQQPGSSEFCSVNTFRLGWSTFLENLVFDKCFQCPICKDAPDVLVMDGKMITIGQDKLLPTFQHVTTPCAGVPQPRPHTRSERCAIKCNTANDTYQVRHQLIALSLRVNEQATSHSDIRPIADGAIPDLLSCVPGPFVGVLQMICALCLLPNLVPPAGVATASHLMLLKATLSVDPDQGGVPLNASEKKCLSEFVRTIASSSPVCSYFPVCAAEMIEPLLGTHECPDSRAFRQASPVMFGIWHIFHVRGVHSFEYPHLTSMWSELCHLSTACSVGFDGGPILQPNLNEQATCHGAYVGTGICSGLVRVRDRHPCAMDTITENEGSECRHGFREGKRNTGGVFTVFCKHGVCYSFFILPKAEGRNEVYSWIITHLASAPKLIVYDFACALHEYFLNRSPAYVKYTQFCVDRIHWFNHRLCGSGYNLSMYPQHKGVNSQLAEQGNSSLAQVEDAASCMNQTHFMQNLAFYLSCWNQGKLKGISKDSAYLDRLRSGRQMM